MTKTTHGYPQQLPNGDWGVHLDRPSGGPYLHMGPPPFEGARPVWSGTAWEWTAGEPAMTWRQRSPHDYGLFAGRVMLADVVLAIGRRRWLWRIFDGLSVVAVGTATSKVKAMREVEERMPGSIEDAIES